MAQAGRKSIFITGAASGMGRATAQRFAREGWFVGAFDLDEAGLASLRQELGGDCVFQAPLDVTDREAFELAVAAFGEQTGGTLDLLFNNAGIAPQGMLDEMPWDAILRVINVNLLGVIIGVRAGIGLLRATPGSLCLINSSSSSIWGTPGIAAYSATKHAVRGLTEALSVELMRYGVRAADLLPGLIDTALLPDALRSAAPKEGMWRLTPAAEVADTVWRAYHEDCVHWYVPAELKAFDVQATAHPEAVRQERAAMAGLA